MSKYDFKHCVCTWEDYTAITVMTEDSNSSCRIHIYNDEPHVAIVSDLYVANLERRKGTATEMLGFCARVAKSFGCTEISLRSDHDDWVREWYKRIGFEVESSQVWLKKSI